MKILCLIGVIVFFITGCHRNHLSGEQGVREYNSTVIRHFSRDITDSLKKEAACFLLNNLQDHYSNDNGKTDSETLTETQLIKHIEHKCKQLDSCPWLSGISFENFSEYLLPYRIDNDPLSQIYIWKWIGIDFGQPENIAEIRYLPRNDANGIFPENEYELFYYHFPQGWTSMGRQIATSYSLTYENVPAGTLYWFRNLTTGIEERIFTWENNKMRSW